MGSPLFMMEVSLGQYFQAGGLVVWNKVPILKGVGYASMVMIGLSNTYYIVIIAWTLYYLFSSLWSPLPWSHCDNAWNTAACFEPDSSTSPNASFVPPASEYWNRYVLSITDDLAQPGGIQLHLLVTLFIAWILVYFVIYRGLHQSGKIIWFTATFPYVILAILFGYGISLSGSKDGILYYVTPKWDRLLDSKVRRQEGSWF
jgi:solute carrier family 6 GABA transporter-like protein 1